MGKVEDGGWFMPCLERGRNEPESSKRASGRREHSPVGRRVRLPRSKDAILVSYRRKGGTTDV